MNGNQSLAVIRPFVLLALLAVSPLAGENAGSPAGADREEGRCERVRRAPRSFQDQSIKAGRYSITLVARGGHGVKRGVSTDVDVELRPTSREDVSPVTGELADDDIDNVPLHGWLAGDLSVVNAPICPELDPAPTSTDPVHPGVLVLLVDWEEGYPEGTPVLLIGTVSNHRERPRVIEDDGGEAEIITVRTDGCGIGLWVRRIDEGGFSGEWDGWGTVAGGRGHFCAYRVEEPGTVR